MWFQEGSSLKWTGEKRICEAGEIVCIPSNQWHYGKAITDCVLMDVFTPVREEYR